MILVTGSTGQLGKLTISELTNFIPTNEIYALARNLSDKTNNFEEEGIHVKIGSYNDYNSLVNAFHAIDTLLFISSNEAFQDFNLHNNVIEAAKQANISRIIYTSTQRNTKVMGADYSIETDIHGWTEKKIMESGLDYTILRNAPYLESIPLILGDEIFQKEFRTAIGAGKISFASRKDMARGIAQVIYKNAGINQVFEFGGPKSISIENIVDELSRLYGKKIGYKCIDKNSYIQENTDAGVPEGIISGQLGFADQVNSGYFDNPTSDLANLINHNLIDLTTILKEHYNL